MRRFLALLTVTSMLMIGCDNATDQPSAESNSTENSQASAESDGKMDLAMEQGSQDASASADGNADAGETPPEGDYGDWLAPPKSLSSRLATGYESMIDGVKSGDVMALINFSAISQQVGGETMNSNPELGYKFFAQAGRALRQAIDAGAEDLPGAFVGNVFYNEACAIAKGGNPEQASKVLGEAVVSGFTDLGLIDTDEDLVSVRALDGFDNMLSEWKQAAREKAMDVARNDLSEGESFPFALAATDVDGNEQSLESLKGKVVIVDVWGTWCPPCRAEIPSFIKLQEKFGEDGFQMIGLNYERAKTDEENLKLVTDYIEENGINYPCIMGDNETRKQIPNFQGFPTTLFIDKAGNVRMKAVGLHEYDYLESVVSVLLSES